MFTDLHLALVQFLACTNKHHPSHLLDSQLQCYSHHSDEPFSAFSFGLVSITCTHDFKTTITTVKIILKQDESIAYSFLSTFASCSARRCFRKASLCSLLSLNSAISSGVFFTRKNVHLFKIKIIVVIQP